LPSSSFLPSPTATTVPKFGRSPESLASSTPPADVFSDSAHWGGTGSSEGRGSRDEVTQPC
jgi:hypothetical protein